MNTRTPIKVIKRDERDRQEHLTEEAKTTKEDAQQTPRDIVTNVTNWVNEFQQKRRSETTTAFKNLFREPPQPSEA